MIEPRYRRPLSYAVWAQNRADCQNIVAQHNGVAILPERTISTINVYFDNEADLVSCFDSIFVSKTTWFEQWLPYEHGNRWTIVNKGMEL